ncbi:MAG: DUF1499 domain-containing protein [Desulfobacterales bacterium]|jgi:uncharacterized protein (DUF1499 family)|nr:DUF1499 domain-containing protein [Desulfobacterales bacterium]
MTKKIKKARSPIESLPPCPNRPNCVSSQSTDPRHAIEPLRYDIPISKAHQKLLKILKNMPRTKIIKEKANYIHAECRTRFLRFVDDLEFLVDDTDAIIHVRSASRVGYSDLGVNRKRVEQFRREFETELAKSKEKDKTGKKR